MKPSTARKWKVAAAVIVVAALCSLAYQLKHFPTSKTSLVDDGRVALIYPHTSALDPEPTTDRRRALEEAVNLDIAAKRNITIAEEAAEQRAKAKEANDAAEAGAKAKARREAEAPRD